MTAAKSFNIGVRDIILIDLNQVLISNVMLHIKHNPNMSIDEDNVRDLVFNCLRYLVRQFKSNYGSVVIACDSKKYWRKDVFPFYKASRKKDRDASSYDWNSIWEIINKIRDDIKGNFPYRVIEVEGAEADDVIAVLTQKYSQHEPIMIISSDKDFVQLQKYKNVKQYSPIMAKFVGTEDPLLYIREHIIRGDRGDGIPNILSSDNVFVVGERQKSINKKNLNDWVNGDPTTFCTTSTMQRGFKRNQILVDFDYIPDTLKIDIINSYDNSKPATRMDMMDYFIENGMAQLVEVMDEF